MFAEVKAVEEAICARKILITKTIEGELERVNKEFFVSNYGQRYGVPLKEMLTTIVGQEGVERKLGSLSKQRKKLQEKMEKAKTFAYSSKP